MKHAHTVSLATLALLAATAGADQIRLKNGHVVEGILAGETASGVTLTVAGGTVDFSRSSIDSLVKASAEKNAALETEWKERRFLDRANVPAGFETLASHCRALADLRAQAGPGTDLKAVADYKAGIRACSQSLAAAESASPGNVSPRAQPFLKRVRDQVVLAQADFRQTTIQPERRGNAYILRALVNGRTEARFILDTGAEITTLSRDFATRAAIPETGRVLPVGMADGSHYDAPVVRLDSLHIGPINCTNMEAVVLSKSPDETTDGLLGMNILKFFLLRFDPSTGVLQLEQFAPAGIH